MTKQTKSHGLSIFTGEQDGEEQDEEQHDEARIDPLDKDAARSLLQKRQRIIDEAMQTAKLQARRN